MITRDSLRDQHKSIQTSGNRAGNGTGEMMLDQHWLRYAVVVCLVLASQDVRAGDPVVRRAGGILAVRQGTAEWQVVSAGHIAPQQAEARTAIGGPGHIQADAGMLSLGSLSHVNYDLAAHRIELIAGKVYCVPEGSQSWSITAGPGRVDVPPGAMAEVQRTDAGLLAVTALGGDVQVTFPDTPAVTVKPGTRSTFGGTPFHAESAPLDANAEANLRAWTRVLPVGQGMGQLVIKDAEERSATRLNIARYHAEVLLQPPVALVKLDQAFYNPYPTQSEGEFIFSLPPGASVSRFAMFVTPSELIEGEIIERNRADQVYTTIVRGQRDPAILEQIGDNLFKMRVFPVLPRDVKRILLDFTLPLDGRGEQYQMQLPLLSNLQPIWDFHLFGEIRGPTRLASLKSASMPDVKFLAKSPNHVAFDYRRSNFQPTSDFIVSFQQPQAQATASFRRLEVTPLQLADVDRNNVKTPKATLSADGTITPAWDEWNTKPGTYFQADLPVPAALGVNTPADVLVLVDLSANGTLDQVRPALQTTLTSLRDQDRVRVVAVDIVARPLHEGWLTPRTPGVKATLEKFDRQICIGGTDMLMACQSAVEQFGGEHPDRRRVVIYIGDGVDASNRYSYKTLVQRCADEIAKANATLFSVNVAHPPPPPILPPPQQVRGGGVFQFPPEASRGSAPNEANLAQKTVPDGRLFLTRLTEAAGGRSFEFYPLAVARSALFEWLLAGAPTPSRVQQLTIAGCEPVDLYYPHSLLSGEPLRVVGRKLGNVEQLEVSYEVVTGRQKPIAQKVVLTPDASRMDHMVGRYWATQRLQHLQRILAAAPDAGGNPHAHYAIVALSREWSLLTPLTAYLVLETEADYERWNVPRQARRRYWSSDQLPKIPPLPRDWLAKVTPAHLRANQPVKVVLDSEIEEQLADIRKAIDEGLQERATNLLKQLSRNENARRSDEFRTLRGLVNTLQQTDQVLQGMGIRQAWFDLEYPVPTLPLSLDRLLTVSSTVTPNLLQRHPLIEGLLQEIDLPVGAMTLSEFARFIQMKMHVNVVLDTAHLEEEQIEAGKIIELPPLKKISIRSALNHVLDQINATAIDEKHRLRITTKTQGITQLRRVLFPIDDLIVDRPRFDFEDLQDPLFDRDQEIRQRIFSKLQKVTNLKLKNISMNDLAAYLRKELDENVLIDEVKLEEESVESGAPSIDADFENVTLEEGLRWILNEKNLSFHVDQEALQISTKTDIIMRRDARVYSGVGLIFRDKNPNPLARNGMPMSGNWGGGGWGIGNGMMGSMGGMGGGLGGGGFAGGGFGGGGFGGGGAGFDEGVVVSTAIPEANAVSGISADGPPTAATDSVMDDPGSFAEDQVYGGAAFDDNVYSTLQSVLQETGGPPDSPWMETEGEGGAAGVYYPALAFVFRQNAEAHQEIAEYFQQQRALQAKRGTHAQMVPVTGRDKLARGDADAIALISLIMSCTGGSPDSPWMETEGEGGSKSFDKPRKALSFRQTPRALDEISGLLVQLRRERYALLHHSRPWDQGLFFSQQPGLFMGGWQNRAALLSEAPALVTDGELALLQVRRELPHGEWKWTSEVPGPMSQFTLNSIGERLRLAWPGWEIRANGAVSAVTAAELRYAELGNWGVVLREWLDVELPFWPHRSNRDLAALFQVSLAPEASQNPNHVRLRFTPASVGSSPLWIDVVYDKPTGLPVTWESYKRNQLVERTRFTIESADGQPVRLKVVQHEGAEQAPSSGEWTLADQSAAPIADPDDIPADAIRIDRRLQTRATLTALETGLQQTRMGQHQLAAATYRKVLDQQPGHPLVQFMWAWSLGRQVEATDPDQLQAAYAAVVQQGSSDLGRLLIEQGSRHLTEQDLYKLFSSRPAEKQTVADQLMLARQALRLGQMQDALSHITPAWQQLPEAAARLEAVQIMLESHFRLRNSQAAFELYDAVRKIPPQESKALNADMLSRLLGLFEYYQTQSDIVPFYQDLLSRQDPSATRDLKRSLYLRLADRLQGLKRWQALLSALEYLPAGTPAASSELDSLLSEAGAGSDAAALATLAAQARLPYYRQRLLVVHANVLPNEMPAQEIYWKLHQEGFIFRDDLLTVSDRMLEAGHPDRAAAILESAYRQTASLTSLERLNLSIAYERMNLPLDASRVLSDEER